MSALDSMNSPKVQCNGTFNEDLEGISSIYFTQKDYLF
jgi:hypothetical protein